MGLKYYGKETLIVVGSSFSEFPSGLSRADVQYVCRTTKASSFTASLDAKKTLPNFTTFTSQFAATREDRSDGFSYFSATGFKGNPAASSVVLSALVSNLSVPVQIIIDLPGGAQAVSDSSVPITIISDIVTKSYTITTSSSNTLITATPPSTLLFRIASAPDFITSAKQYIKNTTLIKNQWYILTELKTYLSSKIDIISVDRQNYGTIDEVTITWGYSFNFSNPLQLYKIQDSFIIKPF